jgi:hypothetical protein
MNYPKLYTYFLPPVLPAGSGTGSNLAAGTKINFLQDNFFDKIKIVGFSIFDDAMLATTPEGYFLSNQTNRINITLVNPRGVKIVDNISADIFFQDIARTNFPGGLIRKFKPFKIDLQKSYLTTTNTVSDLLFFGFNFWYYEI